MIEMRGILTHTHFIEYNSYGDITMQQQQLRQDYEQHVKEQHERDTVSMLKSDSRAKQLAYIFEGVDHPVLRIMQGLITLAGVPINVICLLVTLGMHVSGIPAHADRLLFPLAIIITVAYITSASGFIRYIEQYAKVWARLTWKLQLLVALAIGVTTFLATFLFFWLVGMFL